MEHGTNECHIKLNVKSFFVGSANLFYIVAKWNASTGWWNHKKSGRSQSHVARCDLQYVWGWQCHLSSWDRKKQEVLRPEICPIVFCRFGETPKGSGERARFPPCYSTKLIATSPFRGLFSLESHWPNVCPCRLEPGPFLKLLQGWAQGFSPWKYSGTISGIEWSWSELLNPGKWLC